MTAAFEFDGMLTHGINRTVMRKAWHTCGLVCVVAACGGDDSSESNAVAGAGGDATTTGGKASMTPGRGGSTAKGGSTASNGGATGGRGSGTAGSSDSGAGGEPEPGVTGGRRATGGSSNQPRGGSAPTGGRGEPLPPLEGNPLSGIVPDERVTAWQPGVPGGIPERTEVCVTLSPSGGDDTDELQEALDSCPEDQVVQLEAGTFNIATAIGLLRPRVTLRGMGPETRLVKPAGTGLPVIAIGRPRGYTAPVDLAEDGLKNSKTVRLANAVDFTPGELVVINQLTNPDVTLWSDRSPPGDGSRGWFSEYDRPVGQTLEVESSDGDSVTFTTPLHIDFLRSSSAHLLRFDSSIPLVTYAGVEDLYVAGGEGGDGGGNIHFYGSAYSWVKNVESDLSLGTSVNLDNTFRCVIRDSYIHSTRDPNPGGNGYGVGVNKYGSDNLIENNAVWAFNKVIVMRASGGGNVVGYNYMEDGFGADYPTIPEVGLNASHMTTPHYELFEGNESFNFAGDAVWGNSVYITVFRNHLTGLRRSVPPLQLVDEVNRRIMETVPGHRYYSFVGNVLGFAGQSPSPGGNMFRYEVIGDVPGGVVPIWMLAADTIPTLIRHGNFDFLGNATVWDDEIASHDLPPSMYLSGKPAFFGDEPWPWVRPETEGDPVGTLPARARFDALH